MGDYGELDGRNGHLTDSATGPDLLNTWHVDSGFASPSCMNSSLAEDASGMTKLVSISGRLTGRIQLSQGALEPGGRIL